MNSMNKINLVLKIMLLRDKEIGLSTRDNGLVLEEGIKLLEEYEKENSENKEKNNDKKLILKIIHEEIERRKSPDLNYIEKGNEIIIQGLQTLLIKIIKFFEKPKRSILNTDLHYSENEVDFAYLIGVFNVQGMDGLQKEIDRLKFIGKDPHDIIIEGRRNK